MTPDTLSHNCGLFAMLGWSLLIFAGRIRGIAGVLVGFLFPSLLAVFTSQRSRCTGTRGRAAFDRSIRCIAFSQTRGCCSPARFIILPSISSSGHGRYAMRNASACHIFLSFHVCCSHSSLDLSGFYFTSQCRSFVRRGSMRRRNLRQSRLSSPCNAGHPFCTSERSGK